MLNLPLVGDVHGLFLGCTLHFQGEITPQPLRDDGGNILLWNGEVYSGLMVRLCKIRFF